MEKILFVHGLASSGAYKMASTLRILLKPATVLAPDFPIDPDEALAQLDKICNMERPNLVVGLSWGGFLVQQLRGGPKKVLINPDFAISRMLRTMVGEVEYLSPRADGSLSFLITQDGIDSVEQSRTLGFFAEGDRLVHCAPLFDKYYPGRGISFPGGHLPTYPEMKYAILPSLIAFCHE